jgi:hypothetical protein
MWLHHLFNLLVYAASIFVDAIGTTFLGLWLGIAFALATTVATLWRIRRKHGADAMMKHWEDDAKIALRVSLVCAAVIYIPVIVWSVGKAVYQDHIYFLAQIKQQRDEAGTAQTQIADMRAQCANSQAISTDLQTQNRDQQNAVDTCLTQTTKLLTPESLKIVVIPVEKDRRLTTSPPRQSFNGFYDTFLVVANRSVSPISIKGTCDEPIYNMSSGPMGGVGVLMGWSTYRSGNSFTESTASAPLTPTVPFWISVTHVNPNVNCKVDAHEGLDK